MKWNPCTSGCTKARKAKIRFRNGHRKFRFDEAISNPRFTGIRNTFWRSGSPNWKNSASQIRSAQRMSCWQRKMRLPLCPKFIPMRDLDVKIGGNEFDRLRRWHKQGKLSKSRGLQRQRFPETSSPRKIASLIRRGLLQNARFAASVLVRGVNHGPKEDEYLLIRSRRIVPHALPDSSAGTVHYLRGLCDGARRRAIREIFSA